MKKFMLTAAVTALMALPGYATAQDESKPTMERFATIADIPAPLVTRLGQGGRNGVYIENYISSVMEPLRSTAADGINLRAEDITRITTQQEAQRRRQNMQQTIQYDLNYDGVVTADEIKTTYEDNRRQYRGIENPIEIQEEFDRQAQKSAEKVMVLDTDKDGKITLAEMAVVPESRRDRMGRETSQQEELLALDPNKDGKLSATELEALARKAFNTVDNDGNGVLSSEEAGAIKQQAQEVERQKRNQRESAAVREKCKIPTPYEAEQIIIAGVYEGDTASNISVADQTETTDVVRIDIEKGDKKIFLVASAFKPVIWQLNGATERVSRMVVAGPSLRPGTDNNDSGDGPINAGVTGVGRDKISFVRARDCGLQGIYDTQQRAGQRTMDILPTLLGRRPDAQAGSYSPLGMKIGSEGGIAPVMADRKQQDRPPAPEKYDATAWQTFIRFQPGGLAALKAEDVVSDAPAVAYQVKPGWAGMAQLVGEGALVPLPAKGKSMEIVNESGGSIVIEGMEGDDAIITSGVTLVPMQRPEGFKIVKDIPYFPTGLYGAHSTAFVIGDGIKRPPNGAGHSRIITEAEYKAGRGLGHGE